MLEHIQIGPRRRYNSYQGISKSVIGLRGDLEAESVGEEAAVQSIHSPVVRRGPEPSTCYRERLQRILIEKAAVETELIQTAQVAKDLETKNQALLGEVQKMRGLVQVLEFDLAKANADLLKLREVSNTQRKEIIQSGQELKKLQQQLDQSLETQQSLEFLRKKENGAPSTLLTIHRRTQDHWLVTNSSTP